MLRASHTTEGQNRDAGERGALIHQSKAYLNNCLFINRRFFEASSVELPLISPSQLFSQSLSLFQHIMMLSVHKANKYPFSESIASKYRASKKTTLLLFNQAIDIQWTARNPHADLIREPVACWQSSDPWHWSDTKTCRFFFFFFLLIAPRSPGLQRERARERFCNAEKLKFWALPTELLHFYNNWDRHESLDKVQPKKNAPCLRACLGWERGDWGGDGAREKPAGHVGFFVFLAAAREMLTPGPFVF